MKKILTILALLAATVVCPVQSHIAAQTASLSKSQTKAVEKDSKKTLQRAEKSRLGTTGKHIDHGICDDQIPHIYRIR